jgi:hypothetical protein
MYGPIGNAIMKELAERLVDAQSTSEKHETQALAGPLTRLIDRLRRKDSATSPNRNDSPMVGNRAVRDAARK